MDHLQIRHILKQWYRHSRRDLPWRETTDPYCIWISEIILQQTRVQQGMEYYLRFIRRFPNVHALAGADIDEVMNVWKGLGYYSRARHLHESAKRIVTTCGGSFPGDYLQLQKLPGIGRYTSAAIASIAFGQPVPVVDGNVFRFIARLAGIFTPRDQAGSVKKAEDISSLLLDSADPGLHNQAMMEFGALVCKPVLPACQTCPLATHCYAFGQNKVQDLPVPPVKKKPVTRYLYYFVITAGNQVLIKRREEKGIWKMLYDFPLLETNQHIPQNRVFSSPVVQSIFQGNAPKPVRGTPVFKHQLTHLSVRARFFFITQHEFTPNQESKYLAVNINALHNYALPRLILKFLESDPFK